MKLNKILSLILLFLIINTIYFLNITVATYNYTKRPKTMQKPFKNAIIEEYSKCECEEFEYFEETYLRPAK